jgi:hemerythrin-like domain-containing protein
MEPAARAGHERRMATRTKKSKKKGGSRASRRDPNDAVSLLERDHEEVRELLGQLEGTTTRASAKRAELLERIALEVRVHAKIEEEIFYPAFRQAGRSGEDEKLFYEAREEHGLVHTTLPQIESTDPATELFGARAKVLKDLIEHHAEEEEDELFPRAKELLGRERLVELGERLRARKEELKAQGGPEPEGDAGREGDFVLRRGGEAAAGRGQDASRDGRGAGRRERGGAPARARRRAPARS